MKIDSSIKPASTPPSNRIKSQQRAENGSASAASDEVRLSSLAGELQAGEAQPPVDSGRVAEIKRAIAEGRFSINAGAIADRLIDSARELVASRREA